MLSTKFLQDLSKKSIDFEPFSANISISMINTVVEDMPGLGI